MTTNEAERTQIAQSMSEILARHYGDKPIAAVLVWYLDEEQLVNVVSNVEDQTAIALLCDAIKISLNLPKAS
jgi:hypothetical protein